MPLGHDMPETRRSRFFPEPEGRIPIANDRKAQDGDEWIGRYLGPYRVQELLSRGGMGLVLLGYDEALRRKVALKVMDAGIRDDADALKRFEREARASAAIPNRFVAGVYLVGLSDDGLPFMAMEYVEGGSLMQAIRDRRKLSFSQIALLMEQVASALQAAQKLNIIHRDIKPANVMLTEQCEAKVVDFGLAKIFFEDSYRTQEGMVLGTPSYMAPEQSQGRNVDHRADIYSFGATFYHVITGRAPFVADSPVQIMMKHVTAPLVPMKSINPAVPVEFDDVVGRCMRKDVDDRYQDYDSLLADIKRVRLQSRAREEGPMIGMGGEASALGGSRVSGSVALPPPPSTDGVQRRSGLSSPPSTTVSVRGVAPALSPDPAEQHHGWTTGRIALVAGSIAVVVIAVVMFAIHAEPEPTTDPEAGVPVAKKPALAVWLEKVTREANASGGNITTNVNQDYIAYRATLDILGSLRDGVANELMDNNRLPYRLAEIAKEDKVAMNFEQDATGAPLDGWGHQIQLDHGNKILRSPGLDGTIGSPDDIVQPVEGELFLPEMYLTMKPTL